MKYLFNGFRKFFLASLLLLVINCLLTSVAFSSTFIQSDTSYGLLCIEAENYSKSFEAADGHHWAKVKTPKNASEGISVAALPESWVIHKTDFMEYSPRMEYSVKMTKTGTHYVWIRANAPKNTSNSLHIGLNNKTLSLDGFDPKKKWIWKRAGTLNVAAPGQRVITVWMRESGIAVDKIVLSTDKSFKPTRKGPRESPVIDDGVSNTKPSLKPIGDKTGTEGQLLTFKIKATDADGTIPSLKVNLNGLPSNAFFEDHGDGSGTFTWTPAYGESGTYENVVFIASDGLSSDKETVQLTINSPSEPSSPVSDSNLVLVGTDTQQLPTPTISLSAAPNPATYGETTLLNWSSTNADACFASDGWSGTKATNGSQTSGALTENTTFTLSCSGPGGSIMMSKIVKVSPAPVRLGNATLTWTPPTTNEDRSTLTDLAGYKIYHGTTSGKYSETVTITNPGVSSYTVENLNVGTHYFAVTAFDANGNESKHSSEASKNIQ